MRLKHKRLKSLLAGSICAASILCSVFSSMAETTDLSSTEETDFPTLWVVGDSTAAEFNDTSYYSPRYGWGTQLEHYFQSVNIRNLAVSGTSSKSFLETSQYQTLMQDMESGDYLIIGFGHNDEKAESGRYTNPNESYTVPGSTQYYLYESYIRPAKERGVTPMLVTPIVRRNLGNNYTGESGHITQDQTTVEGTFPGGDYAKAIWRIGVAKSVPVLDLTRRTRDIYEQQNAQGIKNRHAWTSSRESSIDNTHTNLYGAQCNAWLIVDELLKTNCSLKNYVIGDPQQPQFSETSLNPNYQEHSFTAPDRNSTIWAGTSDWTGTAYASGLTDWKPTVFGAIDGYEYMNTQYFSMQPDQSGTIRMAAGILAPADQKIGVGKIGTVSDGIAMYYQQIPADSNFTLSADVTIDGLDANNQASFGLMVRDDIYLDTVINDTMGDYVAAGPLMLGSSQPWSCFARKNGILTQGTTLTKNYKVGDTVHLEIKKSSDGYTCTFGDNAPVSAGFDFPLTTRDSEHVYAGLFVSRSVDVRFSNIQLTIE
ncbi:MAG: GDSL-type esterase/lipase family protein [Brotaphodocola sp.]